MDTRTYRCDSLDVCFVFIYYNEINALCHTEQEYAHKNHSADRSHIFATHEIGLNFIFVCLRFYSHCHRIVSHNLSIFILWQFCCCYSFLLFWKRSNDLFSFLFVVSYCKKIKTHKILKQTKFNLIFGIRLNFTCTKFRWKNCYETIFNSSTNNQNTHNILMSF